MSHFSAKLPIRLFLLAVFSGADLGVLPALAAEEAPILLTIKGDLIDKIESPLDANNPEAIISAYYDLLATEVLAQINPLRQQLAKLVPDYDVAFTAADSAELTEVKSDIDVCWAAIRTLHAQEFTPEVVDILNQAYAEVYALIGQDY